MVHQICHDKQVLRMFHSKEFLTVAQELGAKTIAQRTSVENTKIIIMQPAPPEVLIEWIKKQKEDLRCQGFGESRNDAPQATQIWNDESTSS
ncbi:hypothetical protein glysoja_041926 [Glycine soja]|uniref:Uncharacterized protein n=1 Tax=Glycine soja TaxID=3848 RepID=A0A0B2QI20_GLYSO|nr:hypothetical protein glysoja_041926 [Glycine soja]